MKGLNIGSGCNNVFPMPSHCEKLDSTKYGYVKKSDIDVDYDLKEFTQINRPENFYDYIYTSHVIEHLLNENVEHIFKESYRMLKKDGIIRITCPDYDKLLKMYLNNENISELWGPCGCSCNSNYDWFMMNGFCYTSSVCKDFVNFVEDDDIISESKFNEIFNEKGKVGTFDYLYNINKKYSSHASHPTGFHINWWNYMKIKSYLEKVGFKDVVLQKNNTSYMKELTDYRFNTTLPKMSIYVEAKK